MLILLALLTGGPTDPQTARPHVKTIAAPDSLFRYRVSVTTPPAEPAPQPDRWLTWDKFWHFSASFVSVGAGYQLGANRLGLDHAPATGAALGGTLTLGLTKELSDLLGPKKHFSWKDLVADAAGIGAGYLVFVHQY